MSEIKDNRSKRKELPRTASGIVYYKDRYKVIHLKPPAGLVTSQPGSQDHKQVKDSYYDALVQAVNEFKQTDCKAIWLQIKPEFAELIERLLPAGFYVHHATKTTIMLALWLRDSRPNNLPVYNTHICGVGGIVLNGDLVLVIKEKSGIGKGFWKFPGGQVDPSEYIHDAIIREIKEETGVIADFRALIGFREMKNFRFGGTDLYWLTLLEATSTTIAKCDNEIEDCQWIPLKDFLDSNPPFLMVFGNLTEILQEIASALASGKTVKDIASRLMTGEKFSRKIGKTDFSSQLYFPTNCMGQKL